MTSQMLTTPQMLLIGAAVLLLALLLLFLLRRRPAAPAPVQAPVDTARPPPPADTPSPFLAAPEGEPDDLSRIKGLGPKLQARLKELGVFHYRQIADWTPDQLALVDSELGQFQGRPARDQWQSQARLLASGDTRGYERAHGKLGPDAPPGDPAGDPA